MALAGVREAKKAAQQRRNSGGNWGNVQRLKIDDGEEKVIRPLDFGFAYVHSVEKTLQGGRKIWTDAVCVDSKAENATKPCPGCEERAKVADLKNDRRWRRSYRFFMNAILRDGPILEREEKDGRVRIKKDDSGNFIEVGKGDVLVLWSGGIRAADELDEADDDYGLYSRDFRVKRKGKNLDTEYKVRTARDEEGNELPPRELTADEQKIAEGKHDLEPLVTPAPYDEWMDAALGTSGPVADVAEAQAPPEGSPFRRRRQQQD